MIKHVIEVKKPVDAATAAQLVQSVSRFKSHISLILNEKTANAKSIMGIISMELHPGMFLEISADGEDKDEVPAALKAVIGGES